ncbi:MAG: heavy metal transporter [Microbacterium sp.]|uniref:heavy metal transporter n=1 Tax=Microbacterium sp. TaxID=51671 RepID=UPI003F7D61F3
MTGESGETSGRPDAADPIGAGGQLPPRPERVRVTAAGLGGPARPAFDLRSPAPAGRATEPSAVYVRSLIRSQLRLGISAAIGFVVATVAFVLVLALVPDLSAAVVFGVPASWLLLGFGLYPLALTVAVLYVRAAARNEARYRALTVDE